MGQTTKISWCDHTFNPWWGCEKVSPACRSCYAEAFAKRTGHDVWGKDGDRRTFADKHWNEPLKWSLAAEREGVRRRVFCASMADVFEDHPTGERERPRLWDLIAKTPRLDWLLLTKRPENMLAMAPAAWANGWPANVWAGTTAEDDEWANRRLPHLIRVPAATRFVSCEPLLGPIDLSIFLYPGVIGARRGVDDDAVHWVIAGHESGARPRATNEDWVRSLRDQCAKAGAAFFYKQRMELRLKIETPILDGRQWIEFPASRTP